MVPRAFYVSLGAAAGVVAVRRVARVAKSLTPESMVGSLVQSVNEFVADVREGMATREDELREAMGLEDDDEEEPHPAGRHRAGRDGDGRDGFGRQTAGAELFRACPIHRAGQSVGRPGRGQRARPARRRRPSHRPDKPGHE
jgi:hypothetical protein